MGDDALDDKYANPDDRALPCRLRAFFRIRALGTSPDATQGYRTRESIYEIANRKSAALLTSAKQVFESEIWSFLQQPDRPVPEYTRFINAACERRGWYRAPPSDQRLGPIFLGGDEPAFQTGLSSPYRAMLLHLMEAQPDIEALTLLAALFREAYGSFQLDQAVAIRSALKSATGLYVGSTELPVEIGKLFSMLIWDRIVGNQIVNRDSVDDGAELAADAKKSAETRIVMSPAQLLRVFVQRYIDGQFRAADPRPGQVPIVPCSARLEWFLARRESLSVDAALMEEARQAEWSHGDSEEPWRREAAEEARIVSAALGGKWDPPPRLTPDHLPVVGRVVAPSLDEMFGPAGYSKATGEL